MREDHDEFVASGASVLAIAPESEAAIARYLAAHPLPFAVVSDVDHAVFDAYDVASRALSLGQRPALFVVDAEGIVRFDTVGAQQWQIPTDRQVLEVLASLERPPAAD